MHCVKKLNIVFGVTHKEREISRMKKQFSCMKTKKFRFV